MSVWIETEVGFLNWKLPSLYGRSNNQACVKALHFSVSCCLAPLVKAASMCCLLWCLWSTRGVISVFISFWTLCEDSAKEKGYALSDHLSCWCSVTVQIEFPIPSPTLYGRGLHNKLLGYILFILCAVSFHLKFSSILCLKL